jgi:hypothetical protein
MSCTKIIIVSAFLLLICFLVVQFLNGKNIIEGHGGGGGGGRGGGGRGGGGFGHGGRGWGGRGWGGRGWRGHGWGGRGWRGRGYYGNNYYYGGGTPLYVYCDEDDYLCPYRYYSIFY